ncbi:FAD-binding protein [Pseudahrensia aquimaris]|uniref:FAD-binding protein n=1 Tax=Pseudahrensia aquimaris TaxID=744461 RepID=A0ABW3FCG7_9HYPH
MTSTDLHPKTADDVLAAVKWAAGEETPIEIIGQGTKRALGKPTQTAHTLDLSALTGVTLFEPEELVLSARAGTPLAEIDKLLDDANQEFQFEPVDLGPLLGQKPGQGTLGGLVNTNFAGPRRLKSGSARDHILGISAVSGRGEVFKSGGRVVKNVTGYDLSKGVTGAWGTLAVLTDITMKVLPRAETEKTLVLEGLDDAKAAAAMALAMGSNAEVSGAAHLPAGVDGDKAATCFRLEGFKPSVEYRIANLSKLLSDFGKHEQITEAGSRKRWAALRDCLPFADDQTSTVWRISCTPTEGHRIVADLKSGIDCSAFYDWQGGLIWLNVIGGDAQAEAVRLAVSRNGGGHATLIRADAATRQSVDVFEPQPKALAALSKRYRENFDPHGILNPGRMG